MRKARTTADAKILFIRLRKGRAIALTVCLARDQTSGVLIAKIDLQGWALEMMMQELELTDR